MKTAVVIGVVLLLIGCGVQVSASSARDSNVTALGPVWYVGGSGPGNFSLIQDAIDNASNGDTIFVENDSSPYFENLFIDKSLHVIGEDRSSTVVVGDNVSITMIVTGNETVFEGFTITSLLGPDLTKPARNIVDDYGNNTVFRENIFENVSLRAHCCILASNNTFNRVRDWPVGFLGAIEVFGDYSLVETNSFNDCSRGVWIIGCEKTIIRNNQFVNCSQGICTGLTGFWVSIKDNTFAHCGLGIDFNGGASQVVDNIITDGGIGIQVYRVMGCGFTRNVVKNCDLGFNVELSKFCRYTSNDFIMNAQDTKVISSSWNLWGHNYWNGPLWHPKLIKTTRTFPYWPHSPITITWFAVDFHPAQQPNHDALQ